MAKQLENDMAFLRVALQLAKRGYGATSPNPMVGAILVKRGEIIGKGWHRRAGQPHAEIEAIRDAKKHGKKIQGATLYVTLEPCCTHGRTPPCTDAIIAEKIKRVVVGTTDPNPRHAGHGFEVLRNVGIEVLALDSGRARHSVRAASRQNSNRRARSDALCLQLAKEANRLNEAFNHWIVQRTPFVTVKTAMSMDGKIATASGESKWITGEKSRAHAMKLRQGSDAILVGVKTVIADDPSLTIRRIGKNNEHRTSNAEHRILRRIVLDPNARTPVSAKILNDDFARWTTIVVSESAAKKRISELAAKANVIIAPGKKSKAGNEKSNIDLRWFLKKLGAENVTSLLVEGGGETNALFLRENLAQRIAFFYAPKIIAGRDARKGVAGDLMKPKEKIQLADVQWRKLGDDLLLTARVLPHGNSSEARKQPKQ